jgi:hypothetical protein
VCFVSKYLESAIFITLKLSENVLKVKPLMALSLTVGMLWGLGCAQKVKLDARDRKFIAVYADVLVLQGSYATASDSLKEHFNKSDSLSALFAAHAYSPQEFSEQFERYRTDPKRWQEVQMQTLQLLEERRHIILQEKQDSTLGKFQLY